MESSDQAAVGGHWRVLLGDMRTVGALRAATPEEGAAERLTDRALVAAAQNPDHSEAGRAAALAALARRGGTLTRWRIAVPTFLSARDLAGGERLFFGWTVGAALATLCYGAIAAVAIVLGTSFTDRHGEVFAFALLACLLVGYLLPPSRRTARVTVMHAAAPEAFCDAHDRMLRRELGAYGRVVCLEPKPADIKSAAGYRALAQSLGSRFGLALRSAVAGPVRMLGASPVWRPLTLRLLTDSADAIVVDLSSDAAASIVEVLSEAPVARCVFVAIWGRLEEAQSALRDAGLANPCFHYAPDGEMQQRAAFRAAMLDAMRATHEVSA